MGEIALLPTLALALPNGAELIVVFQNVRKHVTMVDFALHQILVFVPQITSVMTVVYQYAIKDISSLILTINIIVVMVQILSYIGRLIGPVTLHRGVTLPMS